MKEIIQSRKISQPTGQKTGGSTFMNGKDFKAWELIDNSGCRGLKKGGAKIIHHHDHRIVMSFYIANLICKKSNKIDDKSSVKTSYPSFFKHITDHTH